MCVCVCVFSFSFNIRLHSVSINRLKVSIQMRYVKWDDAGDMNGLMFWWSVFWCWCTWLDDGSNVGSI